MPIKLPWELATALLRACAWCGALHQGNPAAPLFICTGGLPMGVVSRAKFTANGSPCTVKLMNVDMLCNSQSLPPPSTVRVYMYF